MTDGRNETRPGDLPEPYRSRYDELLAKREAKFTEIVAEARLPEEEVKELVDNWAETELDHLSGVALKWRLQVLLQEHHELGEQMLDILDDFSFPSSESE